MSFYKVVNDGGKDSIARANHIHHDWTHWSGIVYLSPICPKLEHNYGDINQVEMSLFGNSAFDDIL